MRRSQSENNFSNYAGGADVYELAGGVIPELGERFGIVMGVRPTHEALSQLVGAIGSNKVLRDNEEVTAVSLPEAVELVERSGVMEPVSRSLWLSTQAREVDATIMTGGVANWIDRTGRLALSGDVAVGDTVHLVGGNRVMSSATEVSNPNVGRFTEQFGEAPTEARYLEHIIAPLLQDAGLVVELSVYGTGNGDELASRFVTDQPELFRPLTPDTDLLAYVYGRTQDGNKVIQRPAVSYVDLLSVAGNGIQKAAQFRNAARDRNQDYDALPSAPQIGYSTDSIALARTPEQLQDPRNFQSPFTALRNLAVSAMLLAPMRTEPQHLQPNSQV